MNCPTKNKNNKVSPSTAKPATPSPITVPPPKDTCNAFGKLVLAASAVRALASVAIRIPMLPANAEKIAPMTKAGTIIQLVVSTAVDIPNKAAEATRTNTNNRRYSAFKKAKAPSLIAVEISTIRSLPASCFLTQLALINM